MSSTDKRPRSSMAPTLVQSAINLPNFGSRNGPNELEQGSLADIRKARNQARAQINEQINPNEHKKTVKAQAYAAANVEAEQVKAAKVQTLP
jgi:hypothetical protein